MLLSQCSRNVSYGERNSFHPTHGSTRESLAHPCVQSSSETAFNCWTQHKLKVNCKVGGSMGVFCFDCAAVHKGHIFLLIFPPLSVFLLFVCFLTGGIWVCLSLEDSVTKLN